MRLAGPVVLLTVLLAACSPARTEWYKSFDSDRAFANVQKQVSLGPRPSGSAEATKAADQIEAELKSYGLNVTRDVFEVPDTPRGPVKFRNVIATTGSWPLKNDAILLASHYDTKWMPDEKFVGANDAGSSTGCLLEIARVLSKVRTNREFVFVFFDGEEAMRDYTSSDGLFGSRRLSADMKAAGTLARLRAVILLDMIGDKDLKISMPKGDPTLARAAFEASESLGFRDHFSLLDSAMFDDHYPFQVEGIPSIDLIDFDYGPGNSYWHTKEDSIEHICPQSLDVVGKTVLKMLEGMN